MTECTHCRKRYENGVRFCPVDGYAVAPVAEPMLGRTLMGQFQIQSVCGHGATGTVYRATQVGIDREVAVKVLRADLLKDVDVIKRFVREARAGARLNHPNIATVHMVGQTEDGVPFLAMEFVEGVPLSALVGVGKPLPLRRIVHIGAQIASALSEAHGQGIVHRDLKPENILLTERRGEADVVKVVDFGIAKMIAHAVPGEDPISRMGTVFGTPHYIAPEQAAGQPVDGRADIYSLGCILYQMATGRVPFDGQQGLQVLLRQVRDPVPDPRSVNPRISFPLSDLILKMLAKDPAERPQSATLTAAALRELVADAEAAPVATSGGPRSGAAREVSRSGAARDVPRSGSAAVDSAKAAASVASRDSSQDAGWYRDEDGPDAEADAETADSRDEPDEERPRKRRRAAETAPASSPSGGPSRHRSRHPSRSGRPPARPDDSSDYVAAPPPPSFLQRHWMPVVSIGSAVALGALAGLLYAHFHGAQQPPTPPVAPVVVAAPPTPATSLVRNPSRPQPPRPTTAPAQPPKPGDPSLPVTVFSAGPPLSGPRPVAPGTPGPTPTVALPAAPGTPPLLMPAAPTVIAPPPATPTVIAPPPATPPLVTLPTTTVTTPPAATQPASAPVLEKPPAPKVEETPPPAPEKPPAPKPEEPEENNDPYQRLK